MDLKKGGKPYNAANAQLWIVSPQFGGKGWL